MPSLGTGNPTAHMSGFLLNVDCETGYEKRIAENSLVNRSLTFQGSRIKATLEMKRVSAGFCQLM